MVTENNSQINSFVKGMNSDVAYQMVQEGQYTYAKNIRITSLNNTNSSATTNAQGEVRPIEGVRPVTTFQFKEILATGTIRDIGVVIYTDENDIWHVGKFFNQIGIEYKNDTFCNIIVTEVFNSKQKKTNEKFSIVLRWENEDNVMLYIANGEDPLYILNIMKDYVALFINEDIPTDYVRIYPKVVYTPFEFIGLVNGSLRPGLVQYSYQLYNRYSVHTDISPCTKLIPIGNQTVPRGYLQEEHSDQGVKLKLDVSDNKYFDHILIYRISYIQNGQPPLIEVVFDGYTTDFKGKDKYFYDKGLQAISTLTTEEYNSLSGIHIVPQVIESKNDFLFAGNIEDRTSWLTREEMRKIFDNNVTWEYITDDVVLEDNPNDYMFVPSNKSYRNAKVFYDRKTMKRGEIYRFGLIVYNKYGETSNVYYLGDIRIEGLDVDIFDYEDGVLVAHPVGIKFKFNLSYEDWKKYGIVAYEIVRCNRREEDIINLAQGVLSRPGRVISFHDLENYTQYWENNFDGHPKEGGVFAQAANKYGDRTTHFPIGYLTTSNLFYYQKGYLAKNELIPDVFGGVEQGWVFTNSQNDSLYNFVSPEIAYLGESTFDVLKNKPLKVEKLYKIWPKKIPYTIPYPNEIGVDEAQLDMVRDGSFPSSRFKSSLIDPGTNFLKWISTFGIPYYDDTKREGGLFILQDRGAEYTRDHKVTHYGMLFNPFYAGKTDDTYISDYTKYENMYFKLYNKTRDVSCNAVSQASNANQNGYFGGSKATVWGNSSTIGGTRDSATKPTFNSGTVNYGRFGGASISTRSSNQQSTVDTSSSNNDTEVKSKRGGLYNKNDIAVDIDVIKMSDNIPWDQVLEKHDDALIYLYKGYSGTIGGKEYCNIVTFGAGCIECDKYHGYLSHTTGPFGVNLEFTTKNGNALNIDGVNTLNDAHMTFLCNIQQEAEPYGGKAGIQFSTYYSYGDYRLIESGNNDLDVYDGEYIIYPFEYTAMHKYASNIIVYKDAWARFGGLTYNLEYLIPMETSISLPFTSGFEYSKNVYSGTGSGDDTTYIQLLPSYIHKRSVNFSQDKPLYVYNPVYSSQASARLFSPFPNYDNYENEDNLNRVDYRVYYAGPKSNGEVVNSWTNFYSNNYVDLEDRFGALTHLRNFRNQLMYWQEQAFGKLSVNEREIVKNVQNEDLVLGTGGVLERYDYIDNTSGMYDHQFCDTMSDSTLYWFDEHNQEIKAYSASQYRDSSTAVSQLSKTLGVQNLMHEGSDTNKKPWLFFDKKYNEAVFNVLNKDIGPDIVYSEYAKAFTSTYTIDFEGSFVFRNGIYLINKDSQNISQWNAVKDDRHPRDFDGSVLKAKIEYVVNKNPLVTKVFDNQEIITANKPEQYNLEYPHADTNSYFQKHHNYTWVTDLNQSADTLTGKMTLREGNYRYAIPRASDVGYGDRIRGKYMICSMEDTYTDYDASITYILTKFRTSWS